MLTVLRREFPTVRTICKFSSTSQRRPQDFGSGELFRGSASWGVRGAQHPDAGEFSKIFEKFLMKIAKMDYFNIFFKKFNKHCVNFSRVLTKNTNCWEILRNLRNVFKYFLKKLRKIHYFSIFFKKFKKPLVNFFAFGRKAQIIGKF